MAGRAGSGRPGQEERVFDPRREARRQLLRVPLPEDVDARDLDADVRHDLRSLAKDTAELTAQHLVMAGRLFDEDPVQALAHARAASALAGRVGAVREAVGLTAYAAQQWALALAELRTARRITGRPDHLAVLADCERALGRPERALAVLDDPDVSRLDQTTRVELVIVVAGARRDLGELDAAVLLLQGPAQATKARHPWAARLWFAYADALASAGRLEARDWFEKAADVDQGETEALDRLLELDGVLLEDADDDDVEAEPSMTLAELRLEPVTASDAPPTTTARTSPAAADAPAVDDHAHGAADDAPAGADQVLAPADEEAAFGGPGAEADPAPALAAGVSSDEETSAHADEMADLPSDHETGPGRAPFSEPAASTPEPTAKAPLAVPLFSDEAPPPAAAPAEDTVPGQQELFSDFKDPGR